MAVTDNAWPQLGDEPPFVHADDAPYVQAFNSVIANEAHRLRTSCWRHPWIGPVNTASVLVLAANPGRSEDSERSEAVLAHQQRENLLGDRPNFFLGSAAEDTPGAEWYRTRLLTNVIATSAKRSLLD